MSDAVTGALDLARRSGGVRDMVRISKQANAATAAVASTESPAVRREEILARLRTLPPEPRLALINETLAAIPLVPTTANTFFRKELLRLQDTARLEAGLVTREQLQAENSPFTNERLAYVRAHFRSCSRLRPRV